MVERTSADIQIHYADEWAALYLDGKLAQVGDTYLSEERVFELLAVTVRHDDSFMRGQTSREGVAQTVQEVDEYHTARVVRLEQARQLREQADELITRAQTLEGPKRA